MVEQNDIVRFTDNNGDEKVLEIAARFILSGKKYVFFFDNKHDDLLFAAEETDEAYNFDLEDHVLEQLNRLWDRALIRAVVCIDIGDGTCTAHAMRIDDVNPSQFELELLMLDDKKNTEIAAALYYHQNGSIEIGYQEQALPEGTKCITNFKRCPPYEKGNVESWTTGNRDMTPTNADKPDEPPVFPPFSKNMSDFIKKLWKNIRRLNSSGARALADIADGEIAIFVGCPSSGNWSEPAQRAQYEALIRNATGIANVTVVPESTAGICREIRSRKGNMDLSGRVVVLDFGSSTMDFTCIDNGKITERSWTLGASRIERLILRKLCDKLLLQKQNKLREIEDDVRKITDLNTPAGRAYLEKQQAPLLEQINLLYDYPMSPPGDILLKLRKEVKEHYYNTLAQNRKDGIAKTSFLYPFEGMGTVIIDDTFMKDVVAYMPIVGVAEGGDSEKELYPDGKSWMDHCKKILEIIRDDNIESGKFRLVVTGGASKMDFIRPLCAVVFGDMLGEKISDDPAPQDCVSYGLCQVAMNEFKVAGIFYAKCDWLLTQANYAALSKVCQNIYDDLVNYLYDCFQEIMEAAKGKSTMGTRFNDFQNDMIFWRLQAAVNGKMKACVKKATIQSIISKYTAEVERLMNQKYQQIEQEISQTLYGHKVSTNFRYRWSYHELHVEKIDFAKGLEITEFMNAGEEFIRIFSGAADANRTVHPFRFIASSNLSDRCNAFGVVAVDMMRQMGLPAQNFVKCDYQYRDASTFLVQCREFKDQVQKDLDQLISCITLQN